MKTLTEIAGAGLAIVGFVAICSLMNFLQSGAAAAVG